MSGLPLDTNIASGMTHPEPGSRLVQWLAAVDESLLYLSVLTLGEIRKGQAFVTSGRRRTVLEAWLETELAVRFAGRVLQHYLTVNPQRDRPQATIEPVAVHS